MGALDRILVHVEQRLSLAGDIHDKVTQRHRGLVVGEVQAGFR